MACNSREEEGASCSADAHKNAKFDTVDSNAEWRSWEQLEASPPSTSPPWDSEDDDDSGSSVSGPRPSDLYGKFTWKIENFSQISKRELRSNVFEVGGYKWYILVYPQGCDVCNHLSLFLCVADYDKLLPGWSHFAQFTIAVVNKDPKKSKYSDTLHRFCKKEHDWGWKKFMELSKVLDGFTVSDTLVIKAQVQVIRENPHRPFRCLDCQYRRELVRVYLTNVEGICRRFVEEKREKIGKLMEDTVRWSSFRAFWSAVEENVRRRLAREKIDTILKAVVKCFFNEKEVTSTLVMDALYSGCKALDYRSRNKKGKINGVEMEETINPVIWVEKDVFVLAGDVLSLLERAATEPLPPYKDDKGPQNRTKDGSSGDDFGKDSVERDERRLTELGRRTVEMFVLAHLFSNRVEVAYREAIALKRQEELIREEEAAEQAEIELKAKREAAEKEKRTKKKQAKQRRSNRKDKDKEVEEKRLVVVQEPRQREDTSRSRATRGCLLKGHQIPSITTVDTGDDEDDLSVLDTTDDIVGTLGPAMEDGDVERALWERERSEMHPVMEASFSGALCGDSAQNGRSNRKQQALLDDSSSTCSSDSIPSSSAASNGSFRRRSIMTDQNHILINRGRGRVDNEGCEKDLRLAEADGMLRGRLDTGGTAEASSSCSSAGLDTEIVIASLKNRIQWLQQRLAEKEEEVITLQERVSLYEHQMGSDIVNHENNLMRETGDSDQRLRTPDVGPTSPSGIGSAKGEISKNIPKSDEESQDLGTGGRGAVPTSGCAVASSNSLPGMYVTGECGGHNDHSLLRSDSQKFSSSACTKGVDAGGLPEGSSVSSSSLSFVPSNRLSEETVSASANYQGVSTSMVTVTGLSRPSSAPVLVAAPRASFPMTQQLHPPPPLARSVSATGRLSLTTVETSASINPAIQQSPPITPSYRNAAAGVIRSNNSSAHAGQFVPTVSGSAIRSNSSAGSFQYMNSAYVHGLSHPMSAPSCLTDFSSSTAPAYPHKMPVGCGQAVSVATNGVKADAITEAACANLTANGAQAEGVYRMDKMENLSTQRSENGQSTMGFTFGTVTPEMLRLQHQQDQLCECEGDLLHAELDVHKQDYYLQPVQEQQLRQQPEERHAGKELQNHLQHLARSHPHPHESQKYDPIHQHGLSQNVPGHNAVRQAMVPVAENATSGAVLSEEFPHLDIINDLLDEDKIFGKKVLNGFLQQPGNQGFNRQPSFHELHRLSSGQVHPDTNVVHCNGSERSERGIPCDEGGRPQLHSPQDRTNTGIRESIQLLGPYAHPPLPRSFSQHGGSVDGISGHHWPGAHADLPVTSSANGVRNGVDVFIGYPMQSHIRIADCPPFLSQNGYTMYSPMKHP